MSSSLTFSYRAPSMNRRQQGDRASITTTDYYSAHSPFSSSLDKNGTSMSLMAKSLHRMLKGYKQRSL